jgi:isopentenyl diphosphate isomerase/L-lactate dehydrogenase-like FMN-dependent dehydrogenase
MHVMTRDEPDTKLARPARRPLGVHLIVLSIHAGRQLDRAPIPFRIVPNVDCEVGNDAEIRLDAR